eukprot:gnl/MRDRNA2_/MRDRNA2_25215_c0_seq1.p1 gnl/MRDRNA2_/MRDRNA2_25215_c0~~gnl/MRDRNA2_/MRDRNA2_25215_c0_seq1.p1  ORF type:complete len:300 (+),score=45.84 gnl/MRDRNA2_/MRDRNA2_25215_c0_seq1:61-960(+)
MANYVYAVVDTRVGSAAVIDPCWDVAGIWKALEGLGVSTVTTAVYTHRHFDHTGGKLPKSMTRGVEVKVEGLADVLERGTQVAVGAQDVDAVVKQCGVSSERIRSLQDGDVIEVCSDCEMHCLNTPGHTPGSICLQLQQKGTPTGGQFLFTGDTLFIGSCGRYDLPESDVQAMLDSLGRLSKLPPTTVVLPGHNYARPAHSTIGQERSTNMMMEAALSREQESKGGLTMSKVSAQVALPDYLHVAWTVFEKYENQGLLVPTELDQCWSCEPQVGSECSFMWVSCACGTGKSCDAARCRL